MYLLVASILAGALLCGARHWFALVAITAIFFIGAFFYEWRSGAGVGASLATAAALCVMLQVSFLTAGVVTLKIYGPPRVVEFAQADPLPQTRVAPAPGNDRRLSPQTPRNGAQERRSPDNDL